MKRTILSEVEEEGQEDRKSLVLGCLVVTCCGVSAVREEGKALLLLSSYEIHGDSHTMVLALLPLGHEEGPGHANDWLCSWRGGGGERDCMSGIEGDCLSSQGT